MVYRSTKTYGHEIGLSCCFRQWRADSHCAFLHGYALSVKLEFEANYLDKRNWVVDFGGLKEVKEWLQRTFDHRLIVARDDPEKVLLSQLEQAGVARIVWLSNVGCEAFAHHIGIHVQQWLNDEWWDLPNEDREHYGDRPRVRLHSCEVREHGANSAIWIQEK